LNAEREQEILLEAINERAVYASEDEELQVRVYAAKRVPMGRSLVTHDTSIQLDVLLADADYTGSFDVVVYGGMIGGDAVTQVMHATISSGAWQSIAVPVPTNGQQFFYLEIKEPSPDRMAWSAPIWVEKI